MGLVPGDPSGAAGEYNWDNGRAGSNPEGGGRALPLQIFKQEASGGLFRNLRLWLEIVEVGDGALRMCRRLKDRTLVV